MYRTYSTRPRRLHPYLHFIGDAWDMNTYNLGGDICSWQNIPSVLVLLSV